MLLAEFDPFTSSRVSISGARNFASAGDVNVAPQVQVGVRLPNSGPLANAQAILDFGISVESMGFDSVWVHDHLTWPPAKFDHFACGSIEACQPQDPLFFESITTAAVVASRLSRAQIGIAGLALPLRDPRPLAKQLATLDNLIGPGRVIVAVGVGSQREDFAVMGVPFSKRGRITNDYLEALRALLHAAGPVAVDNDNVQFSDAYFFPAGDRVSLWVAGISEAALGRTVRFADGWLTAFLSVDDYVAAAHALDRTAEQQGRDPATLVRAVETYVCVARNHDDAVNTARNSLVHMFKSEEAGLARTVVGSVDEVADRLRSLVAAGATSFELRPLAHDLPRMTEMMSLLAQDVLPSLRH